jgi:hypothetical protein
MKFRFASTTDLILMSIGTIGALATGVSFPIMLIFFGNIIDTGVGFDRERAECFPNITTTVGTTIDPISIASTNKETLDKFLKDISQQAIYLSSIIRK